MLNLHKIVKQVLSEVYSSPDRIYQNQQQFESWNEKDAVPFGDKTIYSARFRKK